MVAHEGKIGGPCGRGMAVDVFEISPKRASLRMRKGKFFGNPYAKSCTLFTFMARSIADSKGIDLEVDVHLSLCARCGAKILAGLRGISSFHHFLLYEAQAASYNVS
jgi:hypothetical protein